MRGMAMIAGMAVLALAPMAMAQQAEPPAPSASGLDADDMAELHGMVEQLNASLATLAEQMGVEAFDFGPVFLPLFEQAFPELPEDADAGFSIGFEINSSRTTAETLEADEDGRVVFGDAAACIARWPYLSVTRFERLSTETGPGHLCVAQGPAEDDPAVWVMVADYFVEGAQRRLHSRVYAAAVTGDGESDGTYADASAIGEAQMPALTALSERINRVATEMLLEASAAD